MCLFSLPEWNENVFFLPWKENIRKERAKKVKSYLYNQSLIFITLLIQGNWRKVKINIKFTCDTGWKICRYMNQFSAVGKEFFFCWRRRRIIYKFYQRKNWHEFPWRSKCTFNSLQINSTSSHYNFFFVFLEKTFQTNYVRFFISRIWRCFLGWIWTWNDMTDFFPTGQMC